MNEENKRLVHRALEEVFAGGDLNSIDEIFHPNFINHEAGPRTPPGPEGLKMTVSWLRSSFSDLHYDIDDMIVEGDKVVARVTSSGRHTGQFIGFRPTGKRFSVEQIHIYRIADSKIIEHWSSRDDLAQGMQLGFIPGGRRPEPAAPSSDRAGSRGATPPPEPSAGLLAKASEIPVGGGRILPEQRLVITQPAAGVFKVFGATCTHMGCTLGEVYDGLIKCPCHGSEYSIADGSVRHGPASRSLTEYPANVADGNIVLAPNPPLAATS